MSSQRHFLYLLPRADPEELNAIEGSSDGLPPCTCSHRGESPSPLPPPPLQLRIRIPPKPTSSNHQGGQSASTSSSTSTSAFSSTCRKSSNYAEEAHRSQDAQSSSHGHPPISSSPLPDETPSNNAAAMNDTSGSTATRTSSRQRTSTAPVQPVSHITTKSDPFPSAATLSPQQSRGFKHQFTSWKLLAPQVKTLSAITNTYLLLESFSGPSVLPYPLTPSTSTSATSSGLTASNHNPAGNNLLAKVYTLAKDNPGLALSQQRQDNIPLPSPAPNDNPDFGKLASSSYHQSRLLPSGLPPLSTLTTIQESGQSDDGRSERSTPSLTHTTTGTSSSNTATATSSSARQSEAVEESTQRHRPQQQARPSQLKREASSSSDSKSGSGSASTEQECSTPETTISPESEPTEALPCPRHSKTQSSPIELASPTSPANAHGFRSGSSSTLSSIGTSLSRTASTTSRRRIPSAYRKEMESVLFAQTASTGNTAASTFSAKSRRSSSSGSLAGAGGCPTPSLTSAIFSAPSNDDFWSAQSSDKHGKRSYSRTSSTTTSPSSSLGRTSISGIPFLLDAPNLIDTRKLLSESQSDPFYMSTSNCNVLHVNDLSWYLEKVLWKLGMHRKGRKEFMSVSTGFRLRPQDLAISGKSGADSFTSFLTFAISTVLAT